MGLRLDSVQVRFGFWPQCLTENADLLRHWHCSCVHYNVFIVADVQSGPKLAGHLMLLPINLLQCACPAREPQLPFYMSLATPAHLLASS